LRASSTKGIRATADAQKHIYHRGELLRTFLTLLAGRWRALRRWQVPLIARDLASAISTHLPCTGQTFFGPPLSPPAYCCAGKRLAGIALVSGRFYARRQKAFCGERCGTRLSLFLALRCWRRGTPLRASPLSAFDCAAGIIARVFITRDAAAAYDDAVTLPAGERYHFCYAA